MPNDMQVVKSISLVTHEVYAVCVISYTPGSGQCYKQVHIHNDSDILSDA